MVEMNSYPANVATPDLFHKVIKRRIQSLKFRFI